MRIAIVGAGDQGKALGASLSSRHEVVFGSLHPGELELPTGTRALGVEEAARFGEIVMITVPNWRLPAVIGLLRTVPFAGKIAVDVTNPLTPEGRWATGSAVSNSELLASNLPGARVVKAFNTVFAGWIRAGGRLRGETLTGFVASDDAAAKETVLGLAREIGLDPVDAGGIESARFLEAAGAMLVHFGKTTSLGWEIGLRLVRG